MAHAVVMKVQLPGDGSSSQQMLEEVVVPHAKTLTGFQSGTWLHNGTDAMGVILFDSEENANGAKSALTPPEGGPQLRSQEVYEVAAQA